jgi:DNA-3-methyladenine glycosylase I
VTTIPASNATRCQWAQSGHALYLDYHDLEWGVPQHDDRILFEFLILEGAQAGLSWSTILNKREGYRSAFADFSPSAVARFGDREISKCIGDASIVRNRAKIQSAVTNARYFLQVQEDFGSFDAYLWRFVDGKPIRNSWKNATQVPASTRESDALSKDLKKRGFKFTGTTIMYAFMQAVGMVNDHTTDCFRWRELDMRPLTSTP